MPVYDYVCPVCRTHEERFVFLRDRDQQVCKHDKEHMERCFIGKGPLMVPDSIPGGQVIENLDSRPTRYYSRTEIKDRMREKGVESFVRHRGTEGSDKSKFTTRWI